MSGLMQVAISNYMKLICPKSCLIIKSDMCSSETHVSLITELFRTIFFSSTHPQLKSVINYFEAIYKDKSSKNRLGKYIRMDKNQTRNVSQYYYSCLFIIYHIWHHRKSGNLSGVFFLNKQHLVCWENFSFSF